MRKFLPVVMIVGVLGFVLSCQQQETRTVAEPEPPAAQPETVESASVGATVDVQGTAWVAEEIGGVDVIDDPQSTLIFFEDGEVSGSGACNRYMAAFEIEGDRIAFGHVTSTKMACPEAVMDQEDRFLEALAKAERIGMTDEGHLVLYPSEGEPTRLSLMPEDED